MSSSEVENTDAQEQVVAIPEPVATPESTVVVVEAQQAASSPAVEEAQRQESKSKPKPEPKPEPKKTETIVEKKRPVARAPHAVSGAAVDEVILSKCVFKNQWQRKSLTVHHVQRRLAELGHVAALQDKDGWYGDITREAVAEFQKACGIAGDGLMDAATFSKLFDGDVNVNINL